MTDLLRRTSACRLAENHPRGRELGSNESIILFSFVQLSVPCHPFQALNRRV
jgi:hypothetical protein